MLSLSKSQQLVIGLLLVALMAFTRGHHFSSINVLPSASLAVFFLAGFYLTGKSIFPILLIEAAALDYAAITWGGVSSFCVSPAYSLLLPAYGTLFLAGQWYSQRYQFTWSTLLPLGTSLLSASVISELFSSGGFYAFSGRFAEPTLIEFVPRFIKYYPAQLSNLAFYIAIAAICHIVFVLTDRLRQLHQENHS